MSTRSILRRRRTVAAVGALAAAATLAAAPASASAEPAAPTGPAAGVTPLLRIFQFGDAIGLPLACNLATSAISTGAGAAKASNVASPIVTQINKLCDEISATGDKYLQVAISKSEALNFINPAMIPIIAAMDNGARMIGEDNEAVVAPFGPTIAGLGGTIAFFEGV